MSIVTVTTEQVHELIQQLAAMTSAASITPEIVANIFENMRQLNDQERAKVIATAEAYIAEIENTGISAEKVLLGDVPLDICIDDIKNSIDTGAVYDVSANNPTSGPNNDGKWESLSALLSDANLSTLIPTSVRKGGMSVKFVQSSDNKYVQYRLMLSTFTTAQFTSVTNWQGVSTMITVGGNNIVESGAVGKALLKIMQARLAVENGTVNNAGQLGNQSSRVRNIGFIDATQSPVTVSLTNSSFVIRTANQYSAEDVSSHVQQILTPSTLSQYTFPVGYYYKVVFCKTNTSLDIDANEIAPYVIVESDDNIELIENCKLFNVNQFTKNISQVYTLQSALTAIPQKYRKGGMIITFRDSSHYYSLYQFPWGDTQDTYFYDTNIWNNIGKNVPYCNVNYETNTFSTYYNLSTAIAAVPTKKRCGGCLISYRVSQREWKFALYQLSSSGSDYWNDINNWIVIEDNTLSNVSSVVYKQGLFNSQNGDYSPSSSNSVCTNKPILITGGKIKIIANDGYVIRAALLYNLDGTFKQTLFSGENKTEFEFEMYQPCYLNYIIRYPDGSDITPNNAINAAYLQGNCILPLDNLCANLYGSKNLLSTIWTNNAINTGTGQPVSTNTRLSSDFLKGNIVVTCPTGYYIRTVVRYQQAQYSNVDVVAGPTSLITYEIPDDGYYYVVTLWDGENGNIDVSVGDSVSLLKLIIGDITLLQQRFDNPKFPHARWIAMGDSITEGYYSYGNGQFALNPEKGWVHFVQLINNYALTNVGIGGTGYACTGPNQDKQSARQLVDTINFANYDLVTLAYGVNDWKYNYTLGSMSDNVATSNNIIPSMRYVIEKILASNPNIKIIVITPLNCKFGTKENNWGIGHAYSNNGTLQDIFDAFVEVCNYYGVEYIDMTHYSCVNRENIASLLLDNVHPSEDCHKLLAREYIKKINCY